MARAAAGRLRPREARDRGAVHALRLGLRDGMPHRSLPQHLRTPGHLEGWGNGKQTRSFCFVDDAVEGIIRLMCSDYAKPLNIGSDEMVSMNEMAAMALALEDKKIPVKHIPGPEGVRGRNSDNTLIKQVLGWAPSITLKDGLARTFVWIKEEIENEKAAGGSTDDYVSSTVMTQTMTKECDMARK
mmetsp:Transcript_41595/g.103114  ORF Transcript_41595/g.103114 Transcript_41595/m.103114 type:complete len:186 (-) Transcript_41595:26-583(-)